MLFYFTGSGNSLYVARQLDTELISIPQIINNEELVFEADKIGIVFPTYGGQAPNMVAEFLEKATFKTDYLYLVPTYGKDDTVVAQRTSEILKEMGKEVAYANTVLMVDNYLPSFDMREQEAMDKNIDGQIAQIKEDIENRKHFIKEPDQGQRDFFANARKIFSENPNLINGDQITVTDKCIGCGICVQVCPLGRFSIVDGKAVRNLNTCEFCLACAHACPQKAITCKVRDFNPNERFRNEHVTLMDIINSNKQI